jgi:hypothetical protein
MTKLCFSCFKRIPLFASRCPNCLNNRQGVFGRIVFGIVLIVAFIMIAHFYNVKDNTDQMIDNDIKELQK